MHHKSTILVLVFLSIVVLLTWFFSGKESGQQLPSDPTPPFELPSSGSSAYERSAYQFTELIDDTGKVVKVRDLKTNREQIGSGAFVLAGGLEGVENKQFDIVFHEDYNFIQISLEGEPLGAVRRQAEENLRVQLGVDAETMCSLDISVRTRLAVNTFYAGQELGLSFCPGSVALE